MTTWIFAAPEFSRIVVVSGHFRTLLQTEIDPILFET